MPKASLATKDAVEVSLGIQEGVIEITGAVVKIHQYPASKKTGTQSDAFACVQLKAMRCSTDGNRIADANEEHIELGIGGFDKNTGTFKFRPGKAENAKDEEPEDLGQEVDTEGNCIFVEEGAGALNKNSKWIGFAESLESKGFKSEVLADGYMPDLVGLKCEVYTETLPKLPGQEKDRNVLKVKRVLQFPYEKKKAAGSTAKAAAGKSAAKPAAAAPAKEEGASGGEALALELLTVITAEYAPKGEDERVIERKKLQTAVQTKLMRNKVPVKEHKGVLDLVKSDEWLTAQTTEDENSPIYGKIMLDSDAGTVTFAEAE